MDGIFGMSWDALWDQTAMAVGAPALGFLNSTDTFYWQFLLAAAVIAVITYIVGRPLRNFSVGSMLRAAFNPKIWLAKSATADYRFYIINGILYPLLAAPFMVTAIGFGLVISHWLTALFGPIDEAVMGPVAIRVAYSIVFFLLLDLGHYVAHLAGHRIPMLWELHKVHHSSEVLTPFTSARFHPLDLFLIHFGRGLGTAIATGVFFYLGAGEVTIYTALGAHIAVTAFQFIGTLRHTHVWISYGPLDHLLISPAMHQIHHSKLEKHFDRNCGWALSIWDRMFGTLYVPEKREEFPMGLGDGSDGTWHGVWTMYSRPIVAIVRLFGGGVRSKEPVKRGV